jgi:hypothetical protein
MHASLQFILFNTYIMALVLLTHEFGGQHLVGSHYVYVSIMHNRIKEFEIDVPHSDSIFF